MKRKFHINNQEVSVSNIQVEEGKVSFLMDGKRYHFDVADITGGYKALIEGDQHYQLYVSGAMGYGKRHVFIDGKEAFVLPLPRSHKRQLEGEKQSFIAPMPGKVVEIHIKPGENIAKGQAVITMEAMKLRHTLHAPKDGCVEEIYYPVGAQVHEGVLLVQFKESK